LLAPQRGLTAIDQNRKRTVIAQSMANVFVAVILAKAGIQAFWIPGRVSLARNDDPTPENVKLCESPRQSRGFT